MTAIEILEKHIESYEYVLNNIRSAETTKSAYGIVLILKQILQEIKEQENE